MIDIESLQYLHMLQISTRPNFDLLYDRTELERRKGKFGGKVFFWRIRTELFRDFQLYSIPFYERFKDSWPPHVVHYRDPPFKDILLQLDIPKREVGLLDKIMKPDPYERLTARQILDAGWMEDEGGNQ